MVVTVDFYPIFIRDCTDDDYYDWLPWDDVSKLIISCILEGLTVKPPLYSYVRTCAI